MGFYVDHVLPRVTDVALSGKEFTAIRKRVCSTLQGDVVEVGFGSGRNVPHYPAAVDRVRAVDPATVGRELAAKRVAVTPIQRRLFGGCHLNRPIDQLISNAGLALDGVDRYYARGPKPFGYLFEGTAIKQ